MKAEFKPLTKLMREVLREVIKATNVDVAAISVALSARSQSGRG